ncbi:MAG: glutathione S-transferase family protein [Cyanobacteria bacterium P01_F01_bin.86]
MKLYGHPDSGHAYKVKLCLEVAGISHDYAEIDIFSERQSRPAEFKNNARFYEVPLLLDQGKAYVQSDAILIYLATQYKILGAEDEGTFNRCVEWLFWEANKIGMCLPQLRASQKFEEFKLTEGAQQWLMARYLHDIQILETELADGRKFIMGDSPTIADFSLCGYLYFLDEVALTAPQFVQGWLARIANLQGWMHPYDLLRA